MGFCSSLAKTGAGDGLGAGAAATLTGLAAAGRAGAEWVGRSGARRCDVASASGRIGRVSVPKSPAALGAPGLNLGSAICGSDGALGNVLGDDDASRLGGGAEGRAVGSLGAV